MAGSFGFLAGPISAGALLDAFGGVEAGAKAYKPAIVSVAEMLRDVAIGEGVVDVLIRAWTWGIRGVGLNVAHDQYLVGGATALSWVLVMTVRYSSSKSLWKRV